MRRWGHEEGKGLGVKGEGMVHALVVEHAAADPKDTSKMSKRQLAKHKAAMANAKQRKWVQAPNARGKIINSNDDAKAKEEGEAGRVICLVGLVNNVEEVDEDLSDEIGEECSKFG
jgi:splicing factor 45